MRLIRDEIAYSLAQSFTSSFTTKGNIYEPLKLSSLIILLMLFLISNLNLLFTL